MPRSELPPLCAQQDFRGRLLLRAPEPPRDLPYKRHNSQVQDLQNLLPIASQAVVLP